MMRALFYAHVMLLAANLVLAACATTTIKAVGFYLFALTSAFMMVWSWRVSHPKTGRDLYEAYCRSSNWKNYRGDPCPPWENLTDAVRKHWGVVADVAA